ncbi:MAG: hypothetical protein KIT45_12850 [Fimbriimonadia bacterium]|nr:hypothetical protein [Fimbriimonadia bacterium]
MVHAQPLSGTSSSSTPAVSGTNTSSGRAGQFTINNSSSSAVAIFGQTNGTGAAVFGIASGTSGFPTGIWGQSAAPNGTGLYGVATSTSGTNYGIYGMTYSSTGYAAYLVGRSYFSSNVGIGTTSPSYLLDVSASSTITSRILNSSAGGTGLLGQSSATTGFGVGVTGRADSANGTGVYALASRSSGVNYGIYALTNSSSGYAGYFVGRTYFSNNAGFGTSSPNHPLHAVNSSIEEGVSAVYGEISATNAGEMSAGVFGYNKGTQWNGIGVRGHSDGHGIGVYGTASGEEGTGVSGHATSTSGSATGVYGTCMSSVGRGILGIALSGTGSAAGVVGQSNSTYGRGVVGWVNSTTGTNYGVYGHSNSSDGYGVYASGRMGASGTKSFQIDHPLHPDTHFLRHFCTEAPEPLNVYSGNVVTDSQGSATIHLPDYFEAINRDFRYQLTVIGSFAHAIVEREITNNQFTIRTDRPHVKVSWRVEATRNDLWVQRNGFQSEQEKSSKERGRYLHPELYGLPNERGIFYSPELFSFRQNKTSQTPH